MAKTSIVDNEDGIDVRTKLNVSEIRPEATQIDIDSSGDQTIDCGTGMRLYDTITANRTIGTVSNLTLFTILDIDGAFTIDFSAALKADGDNEFYGNEYLIAGKNFITLVPKEAGGIIVTYINGANVIDIPVYFSDLATVITSGAAKGVLWSPNVDITVRHVEIQLHVVDDALFTVDLNDDGTTMLSTKLTIDIGEDTSDTAATAAVISVPSVAAGSKLTIDVDNAGTTPKGGFMRIYYTED